MQKHDSTGNTLLVFISISIFMFAITFYLLVRYVSQTQTPIQIDNQIKQAVEPQLSISGANQFGIAPGCCASPSEVQNYKLIGAKWIRFDVNWAVVQSGGSNSYNWT